RNATSPYISTISAHQPSRITPRPLLFLLDLSSPRAPPCGRARRPALTARPIATSQSHEGKNKRGRGAQRQRRTGGGTDTISYGPFFRSNLATRHRTAFQHRQSHGSRGGLCTKGTSTSLASPALVNQHFCRN